MQNYSSKYLLQIINNLWLLTALYKDQIEKFDYFTSIVISFFWKVLTQDMIVLGQCPCKWVKTENDLTSLKVISVNKIWTESVFGQYQSIYVKKNWNASKLFNFLYFSISLKITITIRKHNLNLCYVQYWSVFRMTLTNSATRALLYTCLVLLWRGGSWKAGTRKSAYFLDGIRENFVYLGGFRK